MLACSTKTMPPTRRARAQNHAAIDPAVLNALTVAELRNLCRERKIPFTGNRNSLLNQLRDSGSVPPALNDERTQNQPVRGGHNSNATPARQDHEANDSNFTEGQLSRRRRLIQESIANASREIASEAAMAAVQALQTANSASNPTTPVILSEPSATPRDQVPMPCVAMPAHFRISLPHTSRTFNRVSFSNCQSSYLKTFQLWRRRIIWYSPSTILLFGSPRNRNQPPPLPTSSSGRRHLPHT